MKIRRPLQVLLLLSTPCLVCAVAGGQQQQQQLHRLQKRDDDVLTNSEILELNKAPGTAALKDSKLDAIVDASPSKSTQSAKPYVGTEDAPVDGLDGKPHAGPFVDTTPEAAQTKSVKGVAIEATSSASKLLPTSLSKFAEGANGDDGWKLEDIPEKNDGVMNDIARPVPKKGTTGTEGGVSEKEKVRLANGNQENMPKEPKEAPPLPHSEQERIEAGREKEGKPTGKEVKDGEKKEPGAKKAGGEFGEGGHGMEKPTDLPDKPHNIPHPDPKSQTKSKEDGPPVGSGSGSSWLTDTLPYTEGQRPKSAPMLSGGEVPQDESFKEWFHSFVVSFTMIIFTEIGDKTFLVAALMAMRHSRLVVFSAAFAALAAMTVLSAVLGHIAPTLLPKRLTTLAAALLFLVFGARMLREGLNMPKEAGVGEEMREVEAELEEKEHTLARRASRASATPYNLEAGLGKKEDSSPSRSSGGNSAVSGLSNLLGLVLSPAWVQTFVMTFLGEWGDRSQIATIAMAAGQDYWWVTLGAVTGHACCTGLAVLGGRALAGKVSMRAVTIGGAGAFLVFGLLYMFEAAFDS